MVSSRGDCWGLFQPYAHLSSSRVASGTLVLSPLVAAVVADSEAPAANGGGGKRAASGRSVQQILLTTCVGSATELEEMAALATSICQRVWHQPPKAIAVAQHGHRRRGGRHNHDERTSTTSSSNSSSSQHRGRSFPGQVLAAPPAAYWTEGAVSSLYHFMRCSQLEYAGQEDGRTPVQELVYERPFMVLPPVVEWVRISLALAEHRSAASASCSQTAVDDGDVMQAARVLLPGVDCPVRSPMQDVAAPAMAEGDEQRCLDDLRRSMAFSLLSSGRRDLVPHAYQLLQQTSSSSSPPLAAVNAAGMTPLQVAAVQGATHRIRVLLETGAGVDLVAGCPYSPLALAAISGQSRAARILLEAGANVNGADVAAETPLQLAAGAGHVKVKQTFSWQKTHLIMGKDRRAPAGPWSGPFCAGLLGR